ncbi:S41 family peptidase [Lederbergia lenta]|uniref:S41 family peptidase n=1 Tax=Lederbergia lenta TaxID=1467 RepID=UPI00203B0F59|nr:S41 family peptidase [Lederbergia lenta]MCM3113096.1 S41 family peptidase [Lederbergia lenta]
MKRKWLVVIIVCSFLIGVGGTYSGITWIVPYWKNNTADNNTDAGQETEITSENTSLDKVAKAYDLIQNSYIEKVDESKLIQGAIQGMIGVLKDPYSVYMDKETAASFKDSMDSSFDGIGAQIAIEEGKLVIISPIKNSPAEKAGLKSKDEIINIDGKSVQGLDLYEASSKIRGKKGTVVKLEIRRNGLANPINVSVTRDEVPIMTVFSDVKKNAGQKIGYLEITSFSEGTAKDFTAELKYLEQQGIDGLIVDVRGNPGGMLLSVQEILGQLVTDKKPFVQIADREGNKNPYYSELKKSKAYPITVLIDEGSASASEILAAALKEVNGNTLIGVKTFGKGTVQQPVPMDDGSNIKLTMAKWLTPDGNWIHGKGIEPTIEVAQPAYFHAHTLQLEKDLVKDMNNEDVKIAQELLKGLGYGPGREDGYFDEQTERAVRAFQAMAKLPVTGKITVETSEKIMDTIIAAVQEEDNDLQLQVAIKSFNK